MAGHKKGGGEAEGEFLWLMSLSDLMILLFIFFVVLYSFAFQKMNQSDFANALKVLGNSDVKDPVDSVVKEISHWIEEHELSEQIEVARKNGQIFVRVKDNVFFASGKYELHAKGKSTLASLAKALAHIPEPYKLSIDGHTDDVPINTKNIRNNWDLSSRRGVAVFNALSLDSNIKSRTVITGFGSSQPLHDNRDENGRAIPSNQSKNRRVTLRIF